MIFCIGNGKSREKIDLHFLKKKGIIYGSNALYRDFIPDKLVITDPHMLDEVIDYGYSKENAVITTENSYLDHRRNNAVYIRKHKITTAPFERIHPVNTGWVSIRLAYHFHPEHQIYMIGFDIFGERKTIYDNTRNYPPSTEPNSNQHEKAGEFFLLKDHFCPKIRLTRVIDDGTKIENIDNITTKQFFEEITWQ